MKEFDYEKAKAGAPVCTRDGREVRIVCWDVKDVSYSILALAKAESGNESVMLYTNDGKYFVPELNVGSFDGDLMMASVKRKGWVNIYGKEGLNSCGGCIYPSIERAKEDGEQCEEYITTIHIEWEE